MIELRGVSKRYDGIPALTGIDLEIRPGEVHAICGENGAGKSTLNKILAGAVVPDEGDVVLDGIPLRFGSVADSESRGIAMVHQESAAFLHLSAVENHEIMHEPTLAGGLWMDRRAMRRRTQESLDSVGESFDTERPLLERSVAQRQMVSIARALSSNCRLLILDEPTSSLSAPESEALFDAIRKAREKGVTVLYVSHRLDEIFRLSDRVTVLRDGKKIATLITSETDREQLINLMVGREVESSSHETRDFGIPALEVRNLCRAGVFENINFKVHKGEIVALTGLVGAGRSEVARAIFGLDRPDSGEILGGAKISFLAEDRQHEGLHLELNIRENISMAVRSPQILQRKLERSESEQKIKELSIKTASDLSLVSSLSGGNQQKVLLAKWLETEPEVLILDEPTRGVDVGAKQQIHDLIQEFAERGGAVLVISSDMPEVMSIADRILVMRQGKIAGETSRASATQESILELALPIESAKDEGPTTKARNWISQETVVATLIVLIGTFATIINPTFLSWTNLSDILVKVAPVLVVGTMMTLVILAREIDISVGSLLGFCAAVLGIACSADRMGLPVPIGVGLCLGAGLIGGLANGLLISLGKVPSIVVTLGMLTVLRGGTELLMGGKWIEKMPISLREFGTGKFLQVPYSVWTAVAIIGIGVWITKRTKFGLRTFAIGSNPGAAELRGVPSNRIRVWLFALTGLACGVATLFSATQLQVIESGFGSGFELVVIASVIVGGTSIRGGHGSIFGTVLGAILLGMISTVLIFLRLGESAVYWERAIQGGLILLAVMGDHFWRQRRRMA